MAASSLRVHLRVTVLAAVAALAAGAPPVARAQGGSDPAPASRSMPPAAAAERSAPEPRAAWHIAEDDHVRIEELRVRGESRHITVQPKLPGARPYEILPATGAQDPSQRGRRPPGQSQWRVLSF